MQIDGIPPIEYIKRRRQRNIRIRVRADAVVVSAPWYCSKSQMTSFVRDRETWIRTTVSRLTHAHKQSVEALTEHENHIKLRGEWVPFVFRSPRPESTDWLLIEREKRVDVYPPEDAFKKSSGNTSVNSSKHGVTSGIANANSPKSVVTLEVTSIATPENAVVNSSGKNVAANSSGNEISVPNQVQLAFLKDLARKELPAKFEQIADKLAFNWTRLFIRSQKTKWGTCSTRGNISLNWRLIMCPPEILEYIIIHELCHTVHMNHSKSFWKLVKEHYPHVDEAHKWLKTEGNQVFLLTKEA
jgi:predicted metal-dependent hydrolase